MLKKILKNDPAAELRAEKARQRVSTWKLAVAVGIHPSYLGGVLSGRLPLKDEMRERIERALADLADGERHVA